MRRVKILAPSTLRTTKTKSDLRSQATHLRGRFGGPFFVPASDWPGRGIFRMTEISCGLAPTYRTVSGMRGLRFVYVRRSDLGREPIRSIVLLIGGLMCLLPHTAFAQDLTQAEALEEAELVYEAIFNMHPDPTWFTSQEVGKLR